MAKYVKDARCNGKGWIYDPDDIFNIRKITCPSCKGTGTKKVGQEN